jgi:alpha-ribazole phosphatase
MTSATDCRLYLIRHAEPQPPRPGVFLGQIDVPLNSLGWRQARRLRERLKEIKLEAAFCSDLVRARQTADAALEGRDLSVSLLPELRELSFGSWEARSYEEIEKDSPELLQNWIEDPTRYCPPNGETWTALDLRVRQALNQIAGCGASSIVVVTHGGPLQAFVSGILGMTYKKRWNLQFQRGGLSIIDRRVGRWVIVTLNDTCHLRGLAES